MIRNSALRTRLLVLLAALWVLPALAYAAPAPMPLAPEGRAACRIAVASDASVAEQTAARELADYLHTATGATFVIGRTPAAVTGALIAVGPGAAKTVAPGLDLDKKTLGEDGIVLKAVGKHLVLTGAEGAKRGTLYAVYEFLKRVVGVRWWTHTEEFAPSKPALTVGPPALSAEDILIANNEIRDVVG